MTTVCCPVCTAPLTRGERVWFCPAGHSFDVARHGYVNLLPVTQKHSLHPGDTREQVAARRDFLNGGYYAPIAERIDALLAQFCPDCRSLLDAGCGEGYYLSRLPQIPERWGIDISREAVRFAAVREKSAHFLVATASHLPFAGASFDALLSMFALTLPEEFSRVLTSGGVFLQVLAGQNHLPQLKSLIYPELHHKEKELHPQLPGFTRLHEETLEFSFCLDDAQQVENLLSMTPHFWRITKDGAQRLAQVSRLEDRAQVIFNVYQKA